MTVFRRLTYTRPGPTEIFCLHPIGSAQEAVNFNRKLQFFYVWGPLYKNWGLPGPPQQFAIKFHGGPVLLPQTHTAYIAYSTSHLGDGH